MRFVMLWYDGQQHAVLKKEDQTINHSLQARAWAESNWTAVQLKTVDTHPSVILYYSLPSNLVALPGGTRVLHYVRSLHLLQFGKPE